MKPRLAPIKHRSFMQKLFGFTLIELISVIMLMSIVMLGITGFIGSGVQIYVDATEREQLLGDSRFVIERMNREIRQALPNSIRFAGDAQAHCLEFIPVQWSTFYDDVPVFPEPASNLISAVNLVGVDAENYVDVADPNDFVVVYATSASQAYDVSQVNGSSRKFGLNSITSAALATLTLDANIQFAEDSPFSRLYIVDQQAISYCIREVGGSGNSGTKNIYRHTNAHGLAQQIYKTGGILMAENIDNALSINPLASPAQDDPFRVYDDSLLNNAFVRILLRFKRNDEIVVFNNEIHIPNTP